MGRLWRLSRTKLVRGATLIGLVAGLAMIIAPAADAADWGYEQITPADSSSVGIYGIQASADMSMVVTRTRLVPIPGYRGDGRGMVYTYGMPRVGAPWDVGPIDATNGSQLFPYVDGVAHDGSSVLYSASLRSLGGFGRYRTDAQGGAVNMTVGVGNADGREVYLNTNETILPSDTDPNAADVYLAIDGGGSPPGLPDPDADPTYATAMPARARMQWQVCLPGPRLDRPDCGGTAISRMNSRHLGSV